MCIYTPYTYLIGWSSLKKFYYGVRYAKNCHPDDFWKKYFTSSKNVHFYIKEYGDPDIIQIRKTFTDSMSAIRWETKVLTRMNVLVEKKWLNQNIAKAQLQTPELRKQKSEKLKGRVKSEEFRKKISLIKKGQKVKDSTKQLLSQHNTGSKHPQYGKPSSEEKKLKISLKNKNRILPIMLCPVCHKSGKGSVMKRHQFDRCKESK